MGGGWWIGRGSGGWWEGKGSGVSDGWGSGEEKRVMMVGGEMDG